MTKEEWFACSDPAAMLDIVRTERKADSRRFRLFLAGCCRHVPCVLHDPRNMLAVETTERYADGLATDTELSRALSDAYATGWGRISARLTPRHVQEVRSELAKAAADGLAERRFQADLIRCIFEDRVRPRATLAYLTDTVITLAEAIYQEQAFDRMPILGDALEESGCTDAELLGHCRESAVHARGCWVVDLVLGTS